MNKDDLKVFLQDKIQPTDHLWQLDLIWGIDQIMLDAADKHLEEGYKYQSIEDIGNEIANLITKENTETEDLLPLLHTLILQHCILVYRNSKNKILNDIHKKTSAVDKDISDARKTFHAEKTKQAMEKYHKETRKNNTMNEIKAIWEEWKLDPDSGLNYKNNQDFADNVCKAFRDVKPSTIKKKCTLWTKESNIKRSGSKT